LRRRPYRGHRRLLAFDRASTQNAHGGVIGMMPPGFPCFFTLAPL
jgi:hypothetical protein